MTQNTPIPLSKMHTALTTGLIASGDLPLPFTQEIYLMECHVAGTGYQDLDDVDPTPKTEDVLLLRREPGNAHDDLAIEIFTQGEVKLGYVPRAKNEVPARLMDAGKMLFAKIIEVHWKIPWPAIDIEIFLRDV